VTDRYVDHRSPFMPVEHRTYIKLPTPQEITALVPGFTPVVTLEEARKVGERVWESLES
jgi:hypothetical protein